jgi:hypothetical protein
VTWTFSATPWKAPMTWPTPLHVGSSWSTTRALVAFCRKLVAFAFLLIDLSRCADFFFCFRDNN